MPTKMLPIQQNQAWPPRAAMMENLVKAAFQSAVTALEIGVWFGIGSTNIWLENLKPGSTLFLLDSWKPFASQEDLKDEKVDYKGMDDLSTDAFLSAFLKVKKFETENKDRNIKIQMTRGASSSVLPLLKDDSFDLIYIDGDHKYENSKNDIAQAKRLVKKTFGIICGDDLEKLPTPELMAVSKNHKNLDYLHEPHLFHPGVLLAVAEEFPKVNMVNGFWWIVCAGGIFTTEILSPVARQP